MDILHIPTTLKLFQWTKSHGNVNLSAERKKTHKGQCRSLPWMYKILASELNAEASLAHAPRHCCIMYKDEDKITPEEWINLELTTNQMQPAWWIKQDFEICDSAVQVGTYMTPLTDIETSRLSEWQIWHWGIKRISTAMMNLHIIVQVAPWNFIS